MKISYYAFIAIMTIIISQNGAIANSETWILAVNKLKSQYMILIDSEITSEMSAKQFNIEYPVKESIKSYNDVLIEAKKNAENKTKIDLQNYIKQNEDKQSEDKFIIWKKGERVEFADKRGWVNNGTIEYIDSNGIKIKGHFTSSFDLPDCLRCLIDEKY
jgi:hypothetical protein